MSNPDPKWWENWNLSYVDDAFGPMYGGHSVQEAVVATIKLWIPTYIAAINRNLGSEILKVPIDYQRRPDYTTPPRGACALILVDVPSTVGEPLMQSDGIRADWRVEIMVFVYGTTDWRETAALTQAYTTAVRTLLVHQKGLGGFAETSKYDGEEYLEGEHVGTRTTGIGHLRFAVTVGNINTVYGGPPLPQFTATGSMSGPSILPPSDVPTVAEANVSISKEK